MREKTTGGRECLKRTKRTVWVHCGGKERKKSPGCGLKLWGWVLVGRKNLLQSIDVGEGLKKGGGLVGKRPWEKWKKWKVFRSKIGKEAASCRRTATKDQRLPFFR